MRRSFRHRATLRRNRSWALIAERRGEQSGEFTGTSGVSTSIGRDQEHAAYLGAQPGDALEEVNQILVQAEADDLVGACVMQPRMQLTGLARQLTAVLIAEELERVVDEVHAAMQRPRHVVAQHEELGHAMRRYHVAVD